MFLLGSLILVGAPTAGTHWLTIMSLTHSRSLTFSILNLCAAIADYIFYSFFGAWIALTMVGDTTGQQTSARALIIQILSISPALVLFSILFVFGLIGTFLLFIIPSVMLAVAWTVSLPALAVERLSAPSAFGRSLALTRGLRWPIFAYMTFVWICTLVFAFGSNKLASGGASFSRMTYIPLVGYVVSPLTASISQIVIVVVVTSIYIELARIHEHRGSSTVADVFT